MRAQERAKQIFLIGLLIYGLAGAFHHEYFSFLDGVNLLFHEAGHVFFSFFGQTIAIAGGTLLQLLMPLGLAGAFLFKGELFSFAVLFYWFGQNFFSISDYIQDARAQVLPFVGGEIHDWNYLLGKAHLLAYDQQIGHLVWFLGVGVIFAACYAGFRSLKKTSIFPSLGR